MARFVLKEGQVKLTMRKELSEVGNGGSDVVVCLGGVAFLVKPDIAYRIIHGFSPQREFVEKVMGLFDINQGIVPLDPQEKPVRIIFHKEDTPAGFLQRLQMIMEYTRQEWSSETSH